jgi:hypothetical protein
MYRALDTRLSMLGAAAKRFNFKPSCSSSDIRKVRLISTTNFAAGSPEARNGQMGAALHRTTDDGANGCDHNASVVRFGEKRFFEHAVSSKWPVTRLSHQRVNGVWRSPESGRR